MKFKLLSVLYLCALNGATSSTTQKCVVLRSEISNAVNAFNKDEALWKYLLDNNYTVNVGQPAAGNFFSEIPLSDRLDTVYRKSDLVLILSENVAKHSYSNNLPYYHSFNPYLTKSSSHFRSNEFLANSWSRFHKNIYPNNLPHYPNLNPTMAKSWNCFQGSEYRRENVAINSYPNNLPQYDNLNPSLAKSSSCIHDFFQSFCTDSERYKCQRNFKYRSFDGFCNNLDRPKDGAAGTAYTSFAYQNYYDSIEKFRRSYKSAEFLPNSRELVNKFFNKCINRDIYLNCAPSLAGIMFGQLITHDVTFKPFPQRKPGGPDLQCCKDDFSGPLPQNLRHPTCHPQTIPKNDAFFGPKNMTCMNFLRTQGAFDNECVLSSKKQLNLQTSFLDLSSVYGTSGEFVKSVRTFNGLLRLDGNKVFPLNKTTGEYILADPRTAQTPVLSLLHSLFLREHNRLAKYILTLKPNWNDDTVFQEARRWNIAKYQHIVYNWIKIFIAKKYRNLRLKHTKHSTIITTANEFAHSTFRHLHILTPQIFEYYDENGTKVDEITLSDSFAGPFAFLDKPTQYNSLLRGFFYQKTNFNGCLHEIINLLFKNSAGIGIDLISMDISRTDDHGIQPYYKYAFMCHQKKIKDFEDLSPEISDYNIKLLKEMYRSVFDIHLYVATKLEKTPNQFQFGPTVSCLVNEQFYRYRHADPYFYDNAKNIHPFTPAQLAQIKKATFARLLCDNSDIKRVAKNPFLAVSNTNRLVPCEEIPKVHISY